MSDVSSDDLARFSKLFAALDEDTRKMLLRVGQKRSFNQGEVICREGDEGTEFYVLTRGSASVAGDDFGEQKSVATLAAGQFFGELALLSGSKRQATVTAAEACEVLSFPREGVLAALDEAPQARTMLQKVGLLRTEDTMKKMMS